MKLGILALIDAFRGRKDDAIAEGRRFIEQKKDDVFTRNEAAAYLALVYARTGETDEAIKLIEHLLTVPAELNNWRVTPITLADLKWRWVWDPLRKDPRFQKILAASEPKTIY
jgi:tetratricopeptide (TPR) repeat protein